MTRRSILIVLLVASVLLAWLALTVREGTSPADRIDSLLVAWRMENPPVQALYAMDAAGSIGPWAVGMAIVAIIAARSRAASLVEVLAVAVTAELATALIKAVVGRDRPATAAVGDLLTTASYPSGHVVRAVIATAAVLLLIRLPAPLRVVAMLVGASVVGLMAVARVSGGAHHTSDVIGGVLLGSAIIAGWALVRDVRPPRTGAPGWAS